MGAVSPLSSEIRIMKLLAIVTVLASALYFVGFASNDYAESLTAKVDQRMAQVDEMSK